MEYDKDDPFGYKSGKKSSSGGTDWITSFSLSALESIPELIGHTPSQATQEFRQDNPWSGVGSELLGTAVPYLGWFKAAKSIPRLTKAVESVGKLSDKPIISGALQEGMRLAPFEAGRVAVSQLPESLGGGDKSATDMATSAGLNLALGSGLGGLFHGQFGWL